VTDSGARRRPLISGNWKMNFDHLQAIHAVRDLGLRLRPADAGPVDLSVHPPFTDLRSVQTVIEGEGVPVALGAQNCAVEDSGPFTGEVSPAMLAKLHVDYVIVGHSERRQLFGESDELVGAKLKAVLRNGMTPILCVGETVDERDVGLTRDRLATQVEIGLGGVPPESVAAMVIAYEPVWAIGAGQAATPEDAQEACSWIRDVATRSAGARAAGQVRIQYGGSVNAENTESLLRCPDIDGVLVGGASLDAAAFVGIARAAAIATR
jgi:triosephosphate isomerase